MNAETMIHRLRREVVELSDDSPRVAEIHAEIQKLKSQLGPRSSYRGCLDPDPTIRAMGLSIA